MIAPSTASLRRWLADPRAPLFVVAIAVLVAAPSLRVGLFSDDFGQLLQIERALPRFAQHASWDLYAFVPASREAFRAAIEEGPIPWFTHPEFQIRFFRPLSSWLLTAEHTLWGREPLGYHVTSLCLYAACVWLASRLYRLVADDGHSGAGATVSTLAALIFAVAPSHFQSVGWTAGRHQLVLFVPGAGALLAHLSAVRGGSRTRRWLAPLALVVALLGGEAALGFVAYWVAFDLLGPGAHSRSERARAALPAVAIAGIYLALHRRAGFGAAGGSAYVDPGRDLARFAVVLPTRAVALLGDALGGVPADLEALWPGWAPLSAGLAAIAAVGVLARFAWPAIADGERAALRWLVPGALGAVVVVAGGLLGSRVLFVPSLGSAFVLAVIVRGASARLASTPSRLATVGRGWLVTVHLVLAPLSFVGSALAFADVSRASRVIADDLAAAHDGARRSFVLVGSDPCASVFAPIDIALRHPAQAPATWNLLSIGRRDHRMIRTGARTLRLEAIDGTLLDSRFASLILGPDQRFHVGDRTVLRGATVAVAAVTDGEPTAIDVAFDVDLEDPDLALRAWRGGRFERIAPPPVGGVVDLPWSPGPMRVL